MTRSDQLCMKLEGIKFNKICIAHSGSHFVYLLKMFQLERNGTSRLPKPLIIPNELGSAHECSGV